MSLKPIETKYKGIKFRSKAEAHWAVFFDICHANWEYEPQGFDLGDGVYYLPDFKLTNVPTGFVKNVDVNRDDLYFCKTLWVEVKGVLDDQSAKKIKRFIKQLDPDSDFLMVGSIPFGTSLWDCVEKMDDKMNCDDSINHEIAYYSLNGYCGYMSPDFLACNSEGDIMLSSIEKWYNRVGLDPGKTCQAYLDALNYRFDHRNK